MEHGAQAAYDDFAWFYNRHWGHGARFAGMMIEAFLLPRVPAGGRILDLCCGTGQLARMLTDLGYRVQGLDASAEMLHYARENAPAAEFRVGDARRFTLDPPCHAAVSTFDSLNHIMSLGELAEVFANVYASLVAGGGFLFDLNVREGFRDHWRDSFGIVEDDHVCVGRAWYDDTTRLARIDYTLFRQLETWTRFDLTLHQRCYEEDEVFTALRQAGFTDTRILNVDRVLTEVKHLPRGRSYFLAWKPA